MIRPQQIPDPDNYFQGIDQPRRIICRNVLLFERLTKRALQQKHLADRKYNADRMHHRYVLIHVLRTSGVASLNGKSLRLEAGNLLLITPYQFHHFISVKQEAIQWLFITFELEQGAKLLDCLNFHIIRADTATRTHLNELTNTWLSPSKTTRLEILPLLDRVLMRLTQNAQAHTPLANTFPPAQERSEWIVQVERLVLQSVREGWSLEEVARRANLSDRHLRARFESAMGISPSDYRANYQLHTALSLMRNEQLSLGDIAELSGFNSPPAFTRFIKRMTSQAPSHLRKNI